MAAAKKKKSEVKTESYNEFRERVLTVCAREAPDQAITEVSTNTVRKTVLYYTNPAKNSDKVYIAEILKSKTSTLYDVVFQYGRRGGTLKDGFKKRSVVWSEAFHAYNKVLDEKLKEGYTQDIKGGL